MGKNGSKARKKNNKGYVWKYVAAIFLIAACLILINYSSNYSGKKEKETNIVSANSNKEINNKEIIVNKEPHAPVNINTPKYDVGLKQYKHSSAKQVEQTAAKIDHTTAVDTIFSSTTAKAEKPVVEPEIVNNIPAEIQPKRLRIVHINELYRENERKEKEEYLQASQSKEKNDPSRNLLQFWNWKIRKLQENTPDN